MTRSRFALAAVLLLALVQGTAGRSLGRGAVLGSRRSVVPRSAALALNRSVARRSGRRCGRRSGQQIHVLPGHHRRRGLEDGRRRPELGQRVGRVLQSGVRRRHRRGALQSKRRLRRDGRGVFPGQRDVRRRRLQIDGRRQDLDPPRARDDQANRPPASASDQPRHRVRGGARRCLGPASRPRRLPHARRRTHLAEGALQERERRRD